MSSEEGGIRALVKIVYAGRQDVRLNGADCLKLLASGNKQNQQKICEEGGIRALLDLLRERSSDAQCCAAAVLSDLAQDSETREVIRDGGGIPSLVQVLCEGSEQAQEYAAGTLDLLALQSSSRDAICQEQVIQPLIKLLRTNGSYMGQASAAGLLENMATRRTEKQSSAPTSKSKQSSKS